MVQVYDWESLKTFSKRQYVDWILNLVFPGWFTTFLGWVGEIEDEVHLRPAEADILAEIGNKRVLIMPNNVPGVPFARWINF